MAVQITQSQTQQASALLRPDDQEYWTIEQGKPVQMFWSEMTLSQKLLQLEAERLQAHIDNFGIYR